MLLQLLVAQKLLRWLNKGWGCSIGKVEEVYEGLHKALFKQLDTNEPLVDFIFKLETSLFIILGATNMVLGPLLNILLALAILLNNLTLGGGYQFILLFGLGLFDDLPNACMWVHNWLVLHSF